MYPLLISAAQLQTLQQQVTPLAVVDCSFDLMKPELADGLFEAVADEVFVPDSWGCCAFAGDRGMLHPELTDAAGSEQAAELQGRDFDAYLCSNRTCELGMTRAIGHEYSSFLYLLEEATR